MYRGARSIHAFGIGEIHEIHARYKGKKTGGEARHNTCVNEENTRRYWGKSDRYPIENVNHAYIDTLLAEFGFGATPRACPPRLYALGYGITHQRRRVGAGVPRH